VPGSDDAEVPKECHVSVGSAEPAGFGSTSPMPPGPIAYPIARSDPSMSKIRVGYRAQHINVAPFGDAIEQLGCDRTGSLGCGQFLEVTDHCRG
jgi:hypothetical protein